MFFVMMLGGVFLSMMPFAMVSFLVLMCVLLLVVCVGGVVKWW
jgi:hypothetical protein